MSIWKKLSSWWRKDRTELAAEDARDNDQTARDRDAEDFQGRLDDVQAEREVLGGGYADYERDSERPADPTP